jgi:hypothetical protein
MYLHLAEPREASVSVGRPRPGPLDQILGLPAAGACDCGHRLFSARFQLVGDLAREAMMGWLVRSC